MDNQEQLLINRTALKAVLKKQRISYSEAAKFLNITPTGFCFKISGRNGRGLSPFTETEVQTLRSLFGDSILEPAPKFEGRKKEARR